MLLWLLFDDLERHLLELPVLLSYAWRGFARRRTRTTLAVAGVAMSIALLVAVLAISSSVGGAISDSLDAANADMVIQRRVKPCPFSDVKLPKDLAEIKADVVDKIAALPQAEAVSGVLLLWAFWQGHPTVVAGVDPTLKTIGPVRISQKAPDKAGKGEGKADEESEKSCCAVTAGRYLVRQDDRAVMLTEAYAKAVGKTVGDTIHLGPRDLFKIVGLVDLSGSARIAEAEAFIPLTTAQRMYGKGPIVDTIFVALTTTRSIPLVTAVVSQWIGGEASITTSQNVDAATSAVATLTRRSMLGVSGFVLAFVLLLIVWNALSSVAERLSEVGLMRAIGWRRRDVSRLFVTEEVFGGVIGGVIGCLGGWLAAYVYSRFANLELPSALSSFPPCSTTPAPLALPLATTPSPQIFLLGLAAALLIGSVAGLAASHRAARLDPADALRRL
jgi:ABC-type lipoprotein release transport system permease subunit